MLYAQIAYYNPEKLKQVTKVLCSQAHLKAADLLVGLSA
jgi:hypothetical protein